MINIFVTLIIAKRKEFKDVPLDMQTQVRDELFKRGYDTDGNKLSVE